jgi:hypothetical protein
MVQVDVFWSYGIGAAFAAASTRQLKMMGSVKHAPDKTSPFISKFFIISVLFSACMFAPSGLYLLWHYPQWETMQVATFYGDLPAWLVTLFAITNVTQGILGYWVTNKLIQKGKIHAAGMQFILGHFCMFFILLYGWDGMGWQRFLYDKDVTGVLWQAQPHQFTIFNFLFSCEFWTIVKNFLTGNVFWTLIGMGVIMIPVWLYFIVTWIKEGAEKDPSFPKDKLPIGLFTYARILIACLCSVFGLALISAAIAALMVHFIGQMTTPLTGYLIGLPLFLIIGYFTIYKKCGPVIAKLILLDDPQK